MDDFFLPGLPPVVQEAFKRLLNRGIKKRHLSREVIELLEPEYGSNANGEYVRWGNGLQVCWRQEIVGTVQDFPNTFNLLDDRPFPAVFAELISIQATVGVGSDQPGTRGAFYITCAGEALNKWSRLCIVRHANASGAHQKVYVNLLAIGRWK